MRFEQIENPDDPNDVRVHVILRDYHVEWMSEHNIQRSGFIRDLLDDVILADSSTDTPDNPQTDNEEQ